MERWGPPEAPRVEVIPLEAVRKCPHLILHPKHYQDNECRCKDSQHTEMREWGYHWDQERCAWVEPQESEEE